MSPRVTRSSARLSAASPSNSEPQTSPQQPATSSRKRKALPREPTPEGQTEAEPPKRGRAKRAKTQVSSSPPRPQPASSAHRRRSKAGNPTAMSSSGPSSGPSENKSTEQGTGSSSTGKRRSNHGKDNQTTNTTASSTRRTRKSAARLDEDVTMKDAPPRDEANSDLATKDSSHLGMSDPGDDGDGMHRHYDDDDDDDDPFTSSFLGHGRPGLSSTLRALGGMMSGMSNRLRGILDNLKQSDPSVQLIALQELSEILLVSTEDNLAGVFSPDSFVKELVKLMQPHEITGEENPEIMLLACRCIANLMEALPQATANVVYGGAVRILCQKLLEIHFIDLAEQALSTLEKISYEFPASIVREGGLTACLTYLDFFATSTQRTAVQTAANCCKNIPDDSFPVIRDVMPLLLNILQSSDQKVVEQGCYCVSRIVESFKFKDTKLEELITKELLEAILRLLLPGTTNIIGPNIHTRLLRVLSITARASPCLSVELFKMNVVDTLYQILTGVSPPSGMEDIANKIDSVVIMQALIHRPREQIFEALNVICELLPNVANEGLTYLGDLVDAGLSLDELELLSAKTKNTANETRIQLLEECKAQIKRFAVILLPTLTDAYSSTVNLNVRQKVLTAQLKMISNLDIDILEDALKPVPYASYLASILSQQDHPTLVTFALQAAELLLMRLELIYRYQFYREGVIYEISRLSNRACKSLEGKPKSPKILSGLETASSSRRTSSVDQADMDHDLDEPQDDDLRSDEDDDDDDEHPDDGKDDDTESDSSSSSAGNPYISEPLPDPEDIITLRAKKFMEVHENECGKEMRDKAAAILDDLKLLADDIRTCCLEGGSGDSCDLFTRLAEYFDGDALESITSYELMHSNVINILLDVFYSQTPESINARSAFVEAFMGTTLQKVKTGNVGSPVTPFSILVNKLQDLLSRAEHFEVITVHQNSYDSNRSSAATMLAKQLRLQLTADDDSGIPRHYRKIMVAIHAIATFKALDDYLRPRISLAADRPSGSHRSSRTERMAALAAAMRSIRNESGEGRSIGSPLVPTPSDATNRSTRKSSKAKSSTAPATSRPGPATSVPSTRVRRSSRRHASKNQPAPPPPPPLNSSDNPGSTLECADEAQLTDDEEMDEEGALDAIVDDFEGDMDDDASDPGAVNFEYPASGKVTARKEDGTRVATPRTATPLQGASSSAPLIPSPIERLAERERMLERFSGAMRSGSSQMQLGSSGLPGAGRMSYASAVQSIPQDWHIEFSVNDQPISNDTTIYRAVHFNQNQPNDVSVRNVWSTIHTIKFKKVAGPPPPESSSLTGYADQEPSHSSTVNSANPTTSEILRLLKTLHELNSNLDDVLSDKKDHVNLNKEALSQFVNTKLTAKLNRQLEEPLIVASNCLPSWSQDLARLYPFLFPFETRHLFLQSTSFGYSRSMTRWQNAQATSDPRNDRHRDDRPFLGRLQRQKVRIARSKIFESAIKVMELYGSSPSILEVEYFEEVGTGLGPTLEFYSTVSKEFAKKKLKFWRENESNEFDEFAFGKQGLFPAPMTEEITNSENGKRILHLFSVLGKFVARSMLDSRIIDVSFNPTFFRIGDGNAAVLPSLGAVKSVDEDLARALKMLKKFAQAKKEFDENPYLLPAAKVEAIQSIEIDGCRVEHLALDFTLPGYPNIELVPNGSNVAVTIDNVGLYIEKVIDLTLGSGVQKQIDAFRTGFSQVFPYSALKAFTPDELVMLFGRVEEDWSLETLMDSVKADHGFNLDSKTVRNLLHTMSELSIAERRDFLQFVTGSPKLPIGGFKSLTPMFTVVCKPSEPPYTSDDYLPSVMTCVNYLKMPDYSSVDILKQKLSIAIKEGQGAFHLS